jgi:multidrug resistance efflux pump
VSAEKEVLLTSLYSLETQLENAKLHYELLKTTSANELDQLSARLQTARKEYETLYTTYNNLSVRAPMAGTLGKIFIAPGEEVLAGTPLFTLIPYLQTPTIQVELTFAEYLTVLSLSEVRITSFSSEEASTST